MTIGSRIEYGSITINLQASGATVLDGFYQETPAVDAVSVADRVDLWLTGTHSELVTLVRSINRALDYAQAHPEDYVWWWWRIDASQPEARTRILKGRVIFDTRLTNRWRIYRVRIGLVIEHEIGWEEAEVQLPLTNTNATNNTSGLTVYNANDGSGSPPNDRVNWGTIAGASVGGDLPAPLRLEITNPVNDAAGVSIIHAGMSTFGTLATLDPLLEAEAASGGTTTTTSLASGGSYKSATLATPGDVLLLTWSMTAARVAAFAGRTYKIIARFAGGSYGDIWFYPYVFFNGVVPLWQGALVRPSYYARSVRDLGSIQLPPWLAGVGSPGPLDLRLYGRRAINSSVSVSLDFLFMMPADGYREYQMTGELEYQKTLVDDGGRDRVWIQDQTTGANRLGSVSAIGNPMMLTPGRDARLYFLHHLITADSAPITRTLSIKAFYRPKRLTL